MKRIAFSLALLFAIAANAQAEFIIDSFQQTVTINGASEVVSPRGGGDISLQVTTDIAINGVVGGNYAVGGATNGQSITFDYTWTTNGTYPGGATFDALQSLSGLELQQLPEDFSAFNAFTGGWNMEIDIDSGVSPAFSGVAGAFAPIALDDAEFLRITFTYADGALAGTGSGTFGSISGILEAVPEPTSLLSLCALGGIALYRRRRV